MTKKVKKKPTRVEVYDVVTDVLRWAYSGVSWEIEDDTPDGIENVKTFFRAKPVVTDGYAFLRGIAEEVTKRYSEGLSAMTAERAGLVKAIDKLQKELWSKRKLKVEQDEVAELREDLQQREAAMDDRFVMRESELDKREEAIEEALIELEESVEAFDEKVAEGKEKLKQDVEVKLRKELKQEATELAVANARMEETQIMLEIQSDTIGALKAERDKYIAALTEQFGGMQETLREAMKHPKFVQTIEGLVAAVETECCAKEA